MHGEEKLLSSQDGVERIQSLLADGHQGCINFCKDVKMYIFITETMGKIRLIASEL